MTAFWPPEPIVHHVRDYVRIMSSDLVRGNKANQIITFDEYGGSGHTNHRAIYRAMRYV